VTEVSATAGAVLPPPALFLGGLIFGLAANLFFRTPIWPGVWVQLLGVLVFILGMWLIASASRTLARHRTSAEPWKPTSKLVQDGPYAFSRNPIYLSFALIYLGLSLIFDSLPALIMLCPVLIAVDRGQIRREERYLEAEFNGDFRRYRLKVRRWV